MSKMIIPEFIIHSTIESIFKYVRGNYADAANPSESYLFKLLDGAGFQRYDYFNEAIKVICSPVDDPRRIEVDLMFNRKHDNCTSIHITLPSESAGENTLGVGEGTEDDDYFEGDDDNDVAGSRTPYFTRRYQSIYNVVITSDNTNEVVLVYHFLKAMLTAVNTHFHIQGLQNMSLGGQDVRPYEGLGNQLYFRAITMSFSYETSVPSIHPQFMGHDIIVNTGTPVVE